MNQLQVIKSKIYDSVSLDKQLAVWRLKDRKIVFTNGCFDVLHLGHIDYLSKASDLGNVLVVGVNTNDSVRRLGKGQNRPIQDEVSRSVILASLNMVSAVILFDDDTPYELIKMVQPDVLVKGADYKIEDIVGYDIVQAAGGDVKTIEFLPGYSTTEIEKKIKGI